ncbi:stage II sporulation protein AA (anti-sigma F factor antagonist) [Sporobacter termitidis DSM 10068]|uniref:Anti-sigma factor antagonist n=1 Tax=Sporobacter termitidis DSM 10068 TaxID=1123282 RepID=A0A1M5VJN9_9FIRM|nr:anti-sigma factor antagonist [Sporobacter termitidis]SHH75466.1 stage II sporulation protein AA (anti-sigma F factor antagonist) [Sporobacter termitidis DSM 10068]
MTVGSMFENGVLTIYLDGELDHHAAKKAVAYIEEKIDTHLPPEIVLDMKSLSFMDSSGIAVVLKTYRRMKEISGKVRVENVNKQPRRVLDASGVERIIKVIALTKEA